MWKTLGDARAALGWWVLVPVIVLILIGVLASGVGSAALAYTNSESFCISCHGMRDNVYAEYQDSIHDTNRSGVRAICSDCHVPKEFIPKMIRKVGAARDVWGWLTGKIDTPEKFEEHRYEMAQRVWTRMKKTDSQACRNCHTASAMSQDLQTKEAWTRHSNAFQDDQTCIDCHFGIAHFEPDGELGPQDMKF